MGIPHADGNFITDRVIAAEEFLRLFPPRTLNQRVGTIPHQPN